MNQKTRHAGIPKSESPEDLLDWAVHELAARWDGRTASVGIVVSTANAPLPSAYWMARSQAADYTLEHANRVAVSDPAAKSKLQQIAVEMLKPSSSGILQVSVATSKGAFFGQLDPNRLARLNKQGASNNAQNARKQLVQSQLRFMHECLDNWQADGNDPREAVAIVADPTDPRAATTAYVLNSAIAKITSDSNYFDGQTVVVVSPVSKAKLLFHETRPKVSQWLESVPAAGSSRVVCLAYGGETCTHGKIIATSRRARP